jgi:hypothetical protein
VLKDVDKTIVLILKLVKVIQKKPIDHSPDDCIEKVYDGYYGKNVFISYLQNARE